MKRLGVHQPTIEDVVEISGIEALHPGGFALTRHTAEIACLKLYKSCLSFAETASCYLDFLCGETIYISVSSPQTT